MTKFILGIALGIVIGDITAEYLITQRCTSVHYTIFKWTNKYLSCEVFEYEGEVKKWE